MLKSVPPLALFVILICLFVTRPTRASAQIYRPPEPYAMWDTWLFKEGEEYHLFFLQSEPGVTWNTIGHAVSSNLVHWTPLPPIPTKGPAGAWDEGPTLTGMTVKHEGQYVMFYGSAKDGQPIGIMTSPDLKTWQKYPANPILVTKPPYYAGTDWRDMCAVYVHEPRGPRWHGYVCAQTAEQGQAPHACIAHLASTDLLSWEYLPPAFASADFVDMEVPDYFELNGWHYLLLSSARSRKDTSGRINASGTYYVMAEQRDGPYRVPPNPLLLGSGRGRFDNYVGRTIPFPGGRLLYHHTAGGPVTWGTPKLVRQNPDGTLWLKYWPGLAKLETRVVFHRAADLQLDDRMGSATWQRGDEDVIATAQDKEPSVLWFPVSPSDAMVACQLELEKPAVAGILWRWDGTQGAALTLDSSTSTASIVQCNAGDSLNLSLLDDYRDPALGAGVHKVRVLVRAHRAEVYLDTRWLFGISLPDLPTAGRIGLLINAGSATFTHFRIAELEPLP